METQNDKDPEFNRVDEQQSIKEAAQKERATESGKDVTSTENDLSLGNSIRNYGEVSGTTFGDQSNTAKFSNMGDNNQGQQGGAGNNDLNDSNRAAGNGGTGYSDYLYEAENEVVSGTSGNALNSKPSDAMQGNDNANSGNS